LNTSFFTRILSAVLAVTVLAAPRLSGQSVESTDTPLVVGADLKDQWVEEQADFARWYVSPGVGLATFEGDEPLQRGFYLTIRLGYDINEWWSAEGSLIFAPSLDENFVGDETSPTGKKSQAEGDVAGFGDTYMTQTYVDFLFHFTRWEKLDPYLTFGAGVTFYGEDVTGDGPSVTLRGGGGIMYHLSEEWALRADARINLAGYNTEFNATADIGFVWTWGAGKLKEDILFTAELDSDGDGLMDRRELEIGTDPYNPDTDGDGLSDGDEVLKYGTDPLNPDSDFDMLSDGAEVLIHSTNPLDPDTDKGGVSDGHEVLEDKTNPLDPSDDAMLFELDIQFDTDKFLVKAHYFADLDKIVKVLQRNPAATALVEGHADRRAKSNYKHNLKLSQDRAAAVRQYIIGKGIDASRLRAVGYGFDRPKAKNDPVQGNLANRRVDVYLYGAGGKAAKMQYLNP